MPDDAAHPPPPPAAGGGPGAGVVGVAANEPRTPVFHVNSQPQVWHEGVTLADVVRAAAGDGANVATALNGRFVPRAARALTPLVPGDAVLLFAAIVGG
jgi:sulfur carrier protein